MLTDKQQAVWESIAAEARQPQVGWVYLDSSLARAVDDERRLLLAVVKAAMSLNSMWRHFGPASNLAREAFDELTAALTAALASAEKGGRAKVTDEESRQLLAIAKAAEAWQAARQAEVVVHEAENSGPADWTRAHAARDRAEDELERCLAALGKGGSS